MNEFKKMQQEPSPEPPESPPEPLTPEEDPVRESPPLIFPIEPDEPWNEEPPENPSPSEGRPVE